MVQITGDPRADALVTGDPLALLIAMVLDQQIPLEKAFRGPYDLLDRLPATSLDAGSLASMDLDDLVAIFATPPALHRYPASMAKRVQDLCSALVEGYGGRAEAVWTGAEDGPGLLKRLKALPGFGDQKARIFLALLAKQLGVRPEGWEAAAGAYGEAGSYRSVADIVDAESLAKVRSSKQAAKAAARAAAPPR